MTLALLGVLILSGCGRQGDEAHVPVECKEGAGAYRTALRAAPGEVRILDRTPISACLSKRATDPADVQAVGSTLIAVARREAASGELLRLGYLRGAVEKGTKRTSGLFQETLRRLDSELAGVDRTDPRYQQGLRAGRETG